MGVFTTREEYLKRLENGTVNLQQYREYEKLDVEEKLNYIRNRNKENTEMTSAGNIHGIDLFGDDKESQDFWEQHNRTKEEYEELASHIPEVQRRLSEGENLESMYGDPEIGSCARLYFSPEEAARVSRYRDTYISEGGNRHRIIAAQNLGHDIPVNVVGEYVNCETENPENTEENNESLYESECM